MHEILPDDTVVHFGPADSTGGLRRIPPAAVAATEDGTNMADVGANFTADVDASHDKCIV